VRTPDDPAIDFEAVRASARLNAPDRYYAALFASASDRADLIALAAFDGEVARIGQVVSDAALGEIRIAWWRDALGELGEAPALTGNPILDQFSEVLRRREIPSAALDDYFEAHMNALYADPPADETALMESFRAIDGVPIRIARTILCKPGETGGDALVDAAARAAGFTRLALTLPYALAAGRSPLPMARMPELAAASWRPQIDWMAGEARAALATVKAQLTGQSRDLKTALLPLALIEPYFRALQNPRHEPSRDLVDIAPLARLWRIARAHWTGAL